MKRIGILYIATGPYIAFWKDFFESFEEFFLKTMVVHYYVFTDAVDIYASDCNRVHIINQKAEPWPLPTLLKFHRFLEIKDKLLQNDFVYQPNANILCVKPVTEEDFLPRQEHGESLLFTIHPGYMNTCRIKKPFERRIGYGARVPYHKNATYVFGAMNGGRTDKYLEFIQKLDEQLIQELKHNRIAKWHDESWINKGIVDRSDYRLLHPGFCYPVGFEVPYEKYIIGVSKNEVFDVKTFKGL